MLNNSHDYLRILRQNLELAIKQANPDSVESIDARMADLQRKLINRTERHENYDELAEEILRLREVREQSVQDDNTKLEYQNRIRGLQTFIGAQPKRLNFSETLVKHLLAKVIVYDDRLIFSFKSGVGREIRKERCGEKTLRERGGCERQMSRTASSFPCGFLLATPAARRGDRTYSHDRNSDHSADNKAMLAKAAATRDYSEGLVTQGGVSTDVFTKALSEETTRDFFNRALSKIG